MFISKVNISRKICKVLSSFLERKLCLFSWTTVIDKSTSEVGPFQQCAQYSTSLYLNIMFVSLVHQHGHVALPSCYQCACCGSWVAVKPMGSLDVDLQTRICVLTNPSFSPSP